MNTNLTVGNNLNVDNDLTVDSNIGTIIPYQHPTAEVQSTMNKYAADTTVKCYRNELVKLMFCNAECPLTYIYLKKITIYAY